MSDSKALGRLFLETWLHNPREVGALMPSGRDLSAAMAEQVEPGSGVVVELGAGTGAVTRALRDRGLSPEQLVVVEKSAGMAEALARRFPELNVQQGDAARLRRLLVRLDIDQPIAVVSSLPLRSLRDWQRIRILKEISTVLPVGGRLVQYTYSPNPPIEPTLANALGFEGRLVRRIAINLPPAAVWVYEKIEQEPTC